MFGFFSYSIIMAITPGPNNLMALQESRQHGFRGSMPFLNGLFVSFFILDFLAFFFTDFLKSISATAVLLMKILGSFCFMRRWRCGNENWRSAQLMQEHKKGKSKWFIITFTDC